MSATQAKQTLALIAFLATTVISVISMISVHADDDLLFPTGGSSETSPLLPGNTSDDLLGDDLLSDDLLGGG